METVTSIHWHGIRQLNNNIADGVNGITECPLAPGDTKVYTFKATQVRFTLSPRAVSRY